METLTAISRWLAKQHVVTWCVQQEGELWCANAFYLFDAQKVAFYILTEEKTRHAQMSGPQAAVAGTVNGQPKTVALIRGVQFKGEIRRLEGEADCTFRRARTMSIHSASGSFLSAFLPEKDGWAFLGGCSW